MIPETADVVQRMRQTLDQHHHIRLIVQGAGERVGMPGGHGQRLEPRTCGGECGWALAAQSQNPRCDP